MITIVLIIHILIALAMVGVILLQRSEGGALGIGGGGMGGFLSGRGQANLLTRTTAFLALGFILTSLVLAILASQQAERPSILDQPAATSAPQAPAATDAPAATEAPAPPETPAAPSAPVAD
jgi:preprotein translocase subunit SecG